MIVQFPNKVLTTPTLEVDVSNPLEIDVVCRKLLEEWATLPSDSKAGLAANQVGLPFNAAIVQGEMCLNLKFKPAKDQKDTRGEGCFSIENASKFFQVERPSYGWASWYDVATKQRIEKKLTGFDARVFQHELDHLQGRLCHQV